MYDKDSIGTRGFGAFSIRTEILEISAEGVQQCYGNSVVFRKHSSVLLYGYNSTRALIG